MTTTNSLRSLLGSVALAALVVTALPATAYVIVLKDGTRLEAKEKPTVQGKNYLYQTKRGANQSVLAAEVDEAKTDEANKAGVGDAQVLGGGSSTRELSTPKQNRPTLSQQIQELKSEGRLRSPDPTPRPPEVMAGTHVTRVTKEQPEEKTARELDPGTNDAFQRALDAGSVHGARLSSAGNAVKLSAVTENEQAVFAALMACARGLKEVRANGRSIEKVDITFATSANENAGRFVMTPEDAESLLTLKTSPQKYFIAAVVF